MLISEVLKQGVDFLGQERESSLECEVLLAYVLGVGREYLVANSEEEIAEELVLLFRNYLKRIQDGVPLAYITREKEFFGLNFYVDERVLIPRPETEHLVERALKLLEQQGRDSAVRLLDVGVGSGNISISLAKNLPSEEIGQIDAVDLAPGALEVARLNAEQHGVEDRFHFYQSDLLECVDDEAEYDLIVANLPYIGEIMHRYVSEETEKYEPNLALFGGSTGLELYKKMFQQLKEKRISFSYMVGEFGFGQGDDMRELLSNYFDRNWRIESDLAGIDRLFYIFG